MKPSELFNKVFDVPVIPPELLKDNSPIKISKRKRKPRR